MAGIDKIYINKGIANLKPGTHSIEFRDALEEDVTFNNEVNSFTKLNVAEIKDYKTITFNIHEGSTFVLTCQFSIIVLLPINIVVNVHKNASFEAYIAELSNCNLDFHMEINLLEKNATANVKLACVSYNDYSKKVNVNVNHLVSKTYGKVDCYGVCKDDGKLLFAGTSYIVHGAIKSKTQQNARIMVFDEASNGIAKPILKIDENDIEASHAAVVGKINDEHLFYLTSRGISEAEAKHLITMGYFNPIISGFDELHQGFISSLIEGRM